MVTAARSPGSLPTSRMVSIRSWIEERYRSGPLRSKASSVVTCFQPASSSPTRMSSGTNASWKTTSLKWCAPERSMMGRMLIPGDRASTRNCESPSCFLSGTTRVRNSAIM